MRKYLSVLFHRSSGAPASCLAARTDLLAPLQMGKLPLRQQPYLECLHCISCPGPSRAAIIQPLWLLWPLYHTREATQPQLTSTSLCAKACMFLRLPRMPWIITTVGGARWPFCTSLHRARAP